MTSPAVSAARAAFARLAARLRPLFDRLEKWASPLYDRLGKWAWPALGAAAFLFLVALWLLLNPRPATVRFEEGLVLDYVFYSTGTSEEHRARFVVTRIADGGHEVAYQMPGNGVTGQQSVSVADRVAGRCLVETVFGGNNTAAGCFSYMRISDALYRDLKLGRPAEYLEKGKTISGPLLRTQRPMMITVHQDDRPVKIRVLIGTTAAGDRGLMVNDDPNAPFVISTLINAWTPDSLARVIERDLNRKGRASTTAILFRPDGGVDDLSGALLTKVADWMAAHPDRRLKVVVHASRQGSTPEELLALSQQRAGSITQLLADRNLATDRIAAEGVGGSQPSRHGWPRNERIDFIVERIRGS